MRRIVLTLAFSMIAGSVITTGAHASCKSEAAALTGAAKTAALKKCEADTKATKPRRASATPEAGPGDDYSMKHKYRPMATDER